jgi:hypothetical protein
VGHPKLRARSDTSVAVMKLSRDHLDFIDKIDKHCAVFTNSTGSALWRVCGDHAVPHQAFALLREKAVAFNQVRIPLFQHHVARFCCEGVELGRLVQVLCDRAHWRDSPWRKAIACRAADKSLTVGWHRACTEFFRKRSRG